MKRFHEVTLTVRFTDKVSRKTALKVLRKRLEDMWDDDAVGTQRYEFNVRKVRRT